ncbi:hypothetical protein HG530_005347 [Fusarium avenaceum]|nr:hypothetical protein HG530_005347 [Fusarium avenaceum]
MSHDTRLQLLEHVILQVVVVLVQRLLSAATASIPGCGKHGLVVINRGAVDVVYRADEIVNDRMLCQFANVCCTGWADKLGFKADEDINLRSVLMPKTLGLYKVFLM